MRGQRDAITAWPLDSLDLDGADRRPELTVLRIRPNRAAQERDEST